MKRASIIIFLVYAAFVTVDAGTIKRIKLQAAEKNLISASIGYHAVQKGNDIIFYLFIDNNSESTFSFKEIEKSVVLKVISANGPRELHPDKDNSNDNNVGDYQVRIADMHIMVDGQYKRQNLGAPFVFKFPPHSKTKIAVHIPESTLIKRKEISENRRVNILCGLNFEKKDGEFLFIPTEFTISTRSHNKEDQEWTVMQLRTKIADLNGVEVVSVFDSIQNLTNGKISFQLQFINNSSVDMIVKNIFDNSVITCFDKNNPTIKMPYDAIRLEGNYKGQKTPERFYNVSLVKISENTPSNIRDGNISDVEQLIFPARSTTIFQIDIRKLQNTGITGTPITIALQPAQYSVVLYLTVIEIKEDRLYLYTYIPQQLDIGIE